MAPAVVDMVGSSASSSAIVTVPSFKPVAPSMKASKER